MAKNCRITIKEYTHKSIKNMSSILEETIQTMVNMSQLNITVFWNITITKPFKLRRELQSKSERHFHNVRHML